MKKYYLADSTPEKIIEELITDPIVSCKEEETVYFIHYRPENVNKHETMRIDKKDSRVLFSMTGSHFKELLKDRVISR